MQRVGHRQRAIDIWPGFVDALAALLIVLTFLLLIFAASQFFLSDVVSGQERSLDRLNTQVGHLADLLALEQSQGAELAEQLGDIQALLADTEERLTGAERSIVARDSALAESRVEIEMQEDTIADQQATIGAQEAVILEQSQQSDAQEAVILDQTRQIDAQQQTLDERARALAAGAGQLRGLRDNIELLEGLRAELEREVATLVTVVEVGEAELTAAHADSARSIAQVELLNRQVKALRDQLTGVAGVLGIEALEADEDLSRFGERLNLALARRAKELTLYRSDFFGRLRKVLGDIPEIEIVGDRFVLRSELLFETASAELGANGRTQVAKVATIVKTIAAEIPADIDWIVRIDGHTDSRAINTPEFPSNWELSAARAIAIVKYLISQGVSAHNLAATGFGEFHPLDPAETEEAYARNRRIEIKLTAR